MIFHDLREPVEILHPLTLFAKQKRAAVLRALKETERDYLKVNRL